MAITDARATRFMNEVGRPIAERVRDLIEDARRAEQAWRDEIGALIPNDAGVALDDGREAEGVSRLNGQEINSARAVWKALVDLADGNAVATLANVETRLGKLAVRTLRQ